MKNKALYISMLILVGIFLTGMYVLKIFFPQEFIFAIENETIIRVGNYIDSHVWLYYICCGITAFITYWLYICASSHRLTLKWTEIVIIILTIVVIRLVGLYVDETLRTILSMCSFFILPAIMNCDIKTLATVYTIHSISQFLTLKIRNLPLFFTNIPNFVTTFIVGIECYLWLVLMYIIFNYKKGETKL